MNDNARKLYDALSQEYDLGTFEQFSSDIQDESKRRKLYDATIQEYDFGEYDSFNKQLGFGGKSTAVTQLKTEEVKPVVSPVYSEEQMDSIWDTYKDVGAVKPAVQSGEKETLTTFGEGVKQGADAIYQGNKYFVGEQARFWNGAQQDAKKALEFLDAQGEDFDAKGWDVRKAMDEVAQKQWEKDYAEFLKVKEARRKERKAGNMGMWERILHKVADPSMPEPVEARRINPTNMSYQRPLLTLNDALKEADGDVVKAREILEKKASEEQWADKTMREASEAMAKHKPVEGAAWWGQMVPQVAGQATAIASNFVPYVGGFLGKALSYGTTAGLTASSAGQAMAEARRAGASDDEVWSAGVAQAVIEAGSEQIPLNRLIGKTGSAAFKKGYKAVADNIPEKELEKLLVEGNKRLGGKLLSGKTAKELVKDMGVEGASEFVAEFLGTYVPIIYADKESYPTLLEAVKNGWEGAKAGFAMGGFLGGGSTALSNTLHENRRKKQGFVELANDKDGNVVEVVGEKEGLVTVLTQDGATKDYTPEELSNIGTFSYDEWKNAKVDAESRNIENAFDKGFNEPGVDTGDKLFTAEQVAKTALGLNTEESIEDFMGERTIDEVAMGDEDLKNKLNAYFKAKAEDEGRRERFEMEKRTRYAEVDKSIDNTANKDDGMVYSATLPGGETVFITDGTVVLDNEGYIDVNRSMDLIALFPDNSKKAIEAGDIREKIEVSNAQELKAARHAEIDSEIDAELSAPKNAFSVNAEDGAHTIEVVEDNGNGFFTIVDNGEQKVIDEAFLYEISGGQFGKPAEGVASVASENTQPVADNVQTTVEPIPTETRGKVKRTAYHVVPIERTLEDLESNELTEDEKIQFAQANIDEINSELQKVLKQEPKMGADIQAYKAAKAQWTVARDEWQKRLDYYNELLNRLKQPVQTSEVAPAVEGVAPQATNEMQPIEQAPIDNTAMEVAQETQKMQPVQETVAESQGGENNEMVEPVGNSEQLTNNVKTEDVNQSEDNLEMVAEGENAPLAEISNDERAEMEARIVDWLSEENLERAEGKTREEIFDEFGNELEPIAYIPKQYISLVSADLKDQRIYCGKGYFIDHALRNHAKDGKQLNVEDVDVSKYLNIQSVLDNPDSVKETYVDGKRTVVFIKKIGRYFAELTQVEEDGKIVLHKSMFNQKKEPYAKLNDIRSKGTSSEGGVSSISHTADAAPAISLESRGDVVSNSTVSSVSEDRNIVSNAQENTQKSDENAENGGEKIYSQEELAEVKEQLGELNAISAPEFAARLFSIKPWKTLEEANAALKELLASYGETLNGQSLAVMPFLDKAQGLIREYNKSQEPRSVEEVLENGDKRITNYNSRGEVATVATERDGKVVSVDSYDEGMLFEHTEYDENGVSTSVTRYDKQGNPVVSGKTEQPETNEVANAGPVNVDTLQLNMSDEDFNALLNGGDKTAISEYLAEMDGLLRIGVGSPLDGQEALREEYRKAVEQYGKENIPAEIMDDLNSRMQPYSDLSRAVFDRKYALQDKLREIEASEAQANELAEKEAKAEHKKTAFGGFLAGKTDLGAGSAEKALSKKYNFDGKVMTVAEFVEDAVGNGNVKLSAIEEPKYKGASRAAWNRMDARQQEADAKRVKESGTKTVYTVNEHDLGKTAYDYAKFLLDKKAEQEKADAKKAVEDVIKPFAKEKREETKPATEKIEDVGEKIGGARKDALKTFSQAFDNATVNSLIELPFAKAFKKPNLKKAVESGLMREEDALFYEAAFNALVNPNKPKLSRRVNNKVLKEWAEQTYDALQVLKDFVEADVQKRDDLMARMLEDKFPTREKELTVIEQRKEWNKGTKAVWGDKTTPNPLWVTLEILKSVGYNAGDKVDIPFGVVKANVFGTGYELYNKKGDRLVMQSVPSVEDAIAQSAWLVKTKRGDMDTKHPVSSFSAISTKSEMGDSGRYRVLWGGIRNSSVKEFDSLEEANAFAEKVKGGVYPIQTVKRRYGYKIVFRNPLSGDRFYVNDIEFETEGEAKQYIEENYDAINELTNELLAKERGETKKEVTADDILEIAPVFKDGWKYAVRIKKEFANNMGNPLVLREFDSRENAMAFAEESKNEVYKTYKREEAEHKKFVFFDTGENSRIGEDYRGGKDVTAQDFMDTFGFRGVQFGNWTNQDDRQMAVNQAYDAFLDLAKLLGVSPKALSLNGELGMAFGSRGSGFGNAHYELGEVVINLTKTKGAGSLAHEWWHALDNYFARRANVPMGMVTDSRSIDMRPELREAYNNLLKMIDKSDYYKRSKAKGDYWGRMHEVTARLMAEWVDQSLKDKGELNTFLSRGANTGMWKNMKYAFYRMRAMVRGVTPMSFEEFEKTPEALAGLPYPSKEEVKEFGDAMRNIFDTVQEQETEDGKVMFYNQVENSADILDNVEKELSLEQTNIQKDEKSILPERIVDRILRGYSRIGRGEQPTGEIADIARRYNEGRTIIADSPLLRNTLKLLRRLTNNEINEGLLPFFERRLQKENNEQYKKEYQDIIELIKRFRNRNERRAVINELSGAELDEDIPLSKIDELFGLYNADNGVAQLYEHVRRIAEQIGLSFSFTELEDVQGGVFDLADNRIMLNAHILYSPFLNNQEKASVIAHEMIHAVSCYAVMEYENGNTNLSPELTKAAKSIVDIYSKKVKGNADLVHEVYDVETKGMQNVPDYGTTSAYEMVAELANPDFAEKLKGIDYDGRSVWRRIWDAIKSIFVGRKGNNDTAYDALMSAFDALVENFDGKAYEQARKNEAKKESAEKFAVKNNANFVSTYKTKDGKDIEYTSERAEGYGIQGGGTGNSYDGTGNSIIQRQTDTGVPGANSGLNADKGEFCVVERVFTENGAFNFTSGEKIESADDVAYIFSALEDAAKEHSFVVYVKDGNPTVIELGMGSFNATMVDIPTASLAYSRINPDHVYFVHNHPSGNLICSDQDVAMLRVFEDMSDVPVTGVIINLKTGKYGTFDTERHSVIGEKRVPKNEERLTVHTLDKQIFAPDYDPMAQPLVRSSQDVAQFLNSQRMGDRPKVSFLILSRANRIIGNIHTPFTDITTDTEAVARYINERVIQFGGENAILYGDFAISMDESRGFRLLQGAMERFGKTKLLDVVHVEGNFTKSAIDLGLLYEPETEYNMAKENGERYDSPEQDIPVEAVQTTTAGGAELLTSEAVQQEADRMDADEVVVTASAVKALAQKLNTNVNIVEDSDSLPENLRAKKGWYDPKTGEVVVVMDNHVSMEDALQTVLHEVVGHRGLRAVLGEKFDEFLDDVFKNASPEVKRGINDKFFGALRKGHALTVREATEEYIAELAERGFEGYNGLWNGIKQWFRDFFRNFMNVEVTDGELRYMLWKNYQRLQMPNVLTAVQERVMENSTNTGDSGLMFRSTDGEIKAGYEKAVTGWWNKFKQGYYDQLRAVRKAQELIAKASGKKIADSEDVYSYAEHLPSINKIMAEQFDMFYMKPFTELLKKLYDKTLGGVKIDDKMLERYANAKHGLERNREMAVKKALTSFEEVKGKKKAVLNEKGYDDWKGRKADILAKKELSWEEKQRELDKLAKTFGAKLGDYSGITAIFDPEDKMKYKELSELAIGYVNSMEEAIGKGNTDEFWKQIKDMTKYSLEQSYKSGLISKNTYDTISGLYTFYVPLRGFTEQTAEDIFDYVAVDHSPLSGVLKRAGGRKSEADNIFATIVNMAHSSIVMGNKNKMKQMALNLAMRHSTPLLSVDNAWYAKVGDEYIPQYPDIKEGMDEKAMADAFAEFEARMKEMEKNGEVVRHAPGLNIRERVVNSWNEQQHAIRVKRNGKEYVVWVNGSPIFANAINGMLKDNDKIVGMGWLDAVNSFRSKAVTQYSPTFIFTNLFRDVQSASMVYGVLRGRKALAKFEKNLGVNSVAMMNLYSKYKSDTLDMNNEQEKFFKEFLENGGETGYTEMISIEEYQKMLNKLTEKLNVKNATGRAFEAVGDGIEFANRSVENLSRFSAYMTSRQMGMSIMQSVNDAKEVSVNFNRRGSGEMGAKVARKWFMFFNPAVQSVAQRILLTEKYPKRMVPILAAELAAGAAQPYLFASLSALLGVGDDDEEDDTFEERLNRRLGNYYNLTDYRRRSSICFPTAGGVVNIPLSHEARVFFGLGELVASIMTGHEEYDNIPSQVMNVLGQSLPFNPVEGWNFGEDLGETLMYNLTPDAIKPFVEVGMNRDFAGNRIHNRTDYNRHLPEWMRGRKGTAEVYKAISRGLSGDESDFGKNVLDENIAALINPSNMEHLVTGYLGGVYTFLEKSAKSAQWVLGDEEYAEFRNIPIVSSFYTSMSRYEEKPAKERTRRDWEDAFKYYQKEVGLLDDKEKAVKNGIKQNFNNAQGVLDAMKNDGDLLVIDVFNDGYKVIKELYSEADVARSAKDMERLNEINNEIYAHKRALVERMEQMAENPLVGYDFLVGKEDTPYGRLETYGDVRDAQEINDMQKRLKVFDDEYKIADNKEVFYQGNKEALDLYDELADIEREISKRKKLMQDEPEDPEEDMKAIRELRTEAMNLISGYNE